jgi:Fe2+ or Zn2+ uptake regulation protein
VDGWFSALDLLVNDVDERLAMVERAQAKLRQEYNITKLRNQVLEVIARAHGIVSARTRSDRAGKERRICQTQ